MMVEQQMATFSSF